MRASTLKVSSHRFTVALPGRGFPRKANRFTGAANLVDDFLCSRRITVQKRYHINGRNSVCRTHTFPRNEERWCHFTSGCNQPLANGRDGCG